MSGIRVILIACLVSLCGVAWGADAPAVPAGARIGIIDFVTNDVTHYHIGSTELKNFLHTYRGNWTSAELFDDPLTAALSGAGFQPVAVEPSDVLKDERSSWLVEEPRDNKLPRKCRKELGRIMTANNLGALIVVADGANSEPAFVDGNRFSRVPGTIQGLGFSTSDEPIGTMKAGIFDFTQIIVVVNTEDGPELVTRDWGGNRVYNWPDFDPGANLKDLPDALIAQLRPVLADAIKARITMRVMPQIKP